ncbi:D-alanyl-D-alanine carboxypeptidase family protein [Lachnospiraceae bacterium 48-21]|jgi:D-alanyl-D-alanine carboxypeptidase (penicillin-binding protein 5/6)|nr:D-alanyl-D-alanine carboxypeptidase [Dorea sp.]
MKKKMIVWSLVFCLMLSGFVNITALAEENEEAPEQLYARSAVLMDADSGRVLFGKEEREIRPMASTTKIMTCILALENQEEGQVVTASAYAAGRPKVKLGVKEQEQFYLRDLLYSLMLESHNDSAVVIAEGISGTVEEFAKLMNQKAGELGCQDTHFVTPNGLDDSDEGGIHATTARDLATIMRYCIKQSPCREEFLEITRTKNYQFSDVDGGRSFSCVNHNAFLDMMDGALTGKTGFTSDAGYCYVGALERDGRTFIVALLACGWPNNKSYKWTDTRKLMEYGIANYQYRDVWEDVVLPDVEVKNGVEEESPYETELYMPVCVEGKEEIPLLLRADEGVEIKTEVKDSLTAPVSKGDVVGSVRYILEGEEIASYQVVAGEDIRERDLNWALCWIVRLALM